MKTSNIILISLFGLGLIFIVALQLYLKSIESDKKSKEFEFNPGLFTALKIDSGWNVIVKNGDTSKITFETDSIKDLFVLDGSVLVLNKIEKDSVKLYPITITTNKVKHVTMFGNSSLIYQTENLDSIMINLYGESKMTIQNPRISNNQSVREKNSGTINSVYANLSDNSDLYIYQNINSLLAELKDSSYCRLLGVVKIEKLSKSKTASLGLW